MGYAIISDSGQQFRVEAGQDLQVDFREANEGDVITFDRVLAISGDDGLKLGKPTIDGALVKAVVVRHEQGEKLVVQKFRRRKNYRRRTGHRQVYTMVRVQEIVG